MYKDASHAELVPYDSKQTHLTERFFGRHSSPCPMFFVFQSYHLLPPMFYHFTTGKQLANWNNSTPNTPTCQLSKLFLEHETLKSKNFMYSNVMSWSCLKTSSPHPSSSFAPAWPACWNSTQRRLPAHSTSVALGDFCPTETHGVKRQKGKTQVRTCCGIAGCGWCCCSRPTCQVSRTSRNIWTE